LTIPVPSPFIEDVDEDVDDDDDEANAWEVSPIIIATPTKIDANINGATMDILLCVELEKTLLGLVIE